ncbi:MAG: MATE family efflux transporter [Clostridia bacterium]|nr:MATE family efflux transporter [Clostridia bacterium]
MLKNSDKKLFAIIFTLAWPTMLEQFMQTAVQYVDTAMVGSLGTSSTAAVGATGTINWLIGGTVSALGIGFLAFISQANGAKRYDDVKKASAQSVLAVFVSGIFFTVLTLSLSGMIPVWMHADEEIRPLASQYFFILYAPMLPRAASLIFGMVIRSSGDTKTPMVIGFIVNIVNVVLNFFLIYQSRTVEIFNVNIMLPGAGLGVIGAALASAAAYTLGGILITVALFRHPVLSPRGASLCPDLKILRPCLRVAFPNMLQRFGTSLGYVVFASMINSLGDVSTAAHTIANTVESAFYIPGYGMQTASATLAGNAIGEGDRRKMRDYVRITVIIETLMMLVSGGLLFIFAPAMVGIFSTDTAVILLGSTVLRMVALSEPFFGISIVLEGVMQGAGKTAMPFVFNIIGMWGIRIVGTFICIVFFSLGLVSAWACMITHNIILFLMFVIYYLRGKWYPTAEN